MAHDWLLSTTYWLSDKALCSSRHQTLKTFTSSIHGRLELQETTILEYQLAPTNLLN